MAVYPELPAQKSFADFWRGLSLPFAALRVVFRSGKLLSLTAICSLITLVTLSALVYLLVGRTDDLLSWAWAKPETWYGSSLWYVVLAATFLALLVVGANTVPLLLLTPFQDPLSEGTEEVCGDFVAPPFSLGRMMKGLGVSVAHTLARIAVLLAGHALLFLLHFIPGLGSVLWTALGFLWTAGWLAGEYLDGPMARHFYRFSDVQRALLARPAFAFGFGTAVYLLLWIPVLNLFFIPLAVVGGTLLFRSLRAASVIGPPPGA